MCFPPKTLHQGHQSGKHIKPCTLVMKHFLASLINQQIHSDYGVVLIKVSREVVALSSSILAPSFRSIFETEQARAASTSCHVSMQLE